MAVRCPNCNHEIPWLRKWSRMGLQAIDRWLDGLFTGEITVQCRAGRIMALVKPSVHNVARDLEEEERREPSIHEQERGGAGPRALREGVKR